MLATLCELIDTSPDMCAAPAEPRATDAPAPPRISVVVRSYNRLGPLAELLGELLAQDHDSFEIVVVDQSTHQPAAELARIEELARDPRVRLLRFPPLGGPGARNAGVRAARGDLLVFIDDDDLPHGTDWLRLHEANFADPRCLGVTGQFIGEDGTELPYANKQRARDKVLSFNVLKWQLAYPRADQRKHVASLMGGNAAIRRTTLERFGLWDECTPIEDEPSIAYRINAGKRPDEYLLFDTAPRMRRRKDVPGGMDKRLLSGPGYARKAFLFLHNVVAHYFPVRFALLYPLYYLYLGAIATEWIWNDSRKHDTVGHKLAGTVWLWLVLPPLWLMWLGAWWVRRLRHGPLRHDPRLAPRA